MSEVNVEEFSIEDGRYIFELFGQHDMKTTFGPYPNPTIDVTVYSGAYGQFFESTDERFNNVSVDCDNLPGFAMYGPFDDSVESTDGPWTFVQDG